MKMTLFVALFFSLITTAQASENVLITPMNPTSQSDLTTSFVPLALPAVMGRTSYDFGYTWVNSLSTVTFKITNIGTGILNYRQAVIYGIAFNGRHNCNLALFPNESCTVRIEFWPHQEGSYNGQFQLRFAEDTSIIDLWGYARR